MVWWTYQTVVGEPLGWAVSAVGTPVVGTPDGAGVGPSVARMSAVSPEQASRTRQLPSGSRCDRQHSRESE